MVTQWRYRGFPRSWAFGLWAIIVAASPLRAQVALGPHGQNDVEQLEREFHSARNMNIVRAVSALPSDVQRTLQDFTMGFAVADIGDPWHSGRQADNPKFPTSQHLFSAISKELYFIVLNTARGAWAASEGGVLILGYRGAQNYCVYKAGNITVGQLRLDSFQSAFATNGSAKPVCEQKTVHIRQ